MKEKVTRGRLLEKLMLKLELPHNTMASSRLQEEWEKAWQTKRRLQIKITLIRMLSLKKKMEV
jgi:hypothetical protein